MNTVDYTNLTPKIGELDMPYVQCNTVPYIDYIASYSQPSTYFKTANTCLSFFEYDIQFDGLYGLWNAIYYGVKELQNFYIERFQGVRMFISPDYSKCGDACEIQNQYHQFQSRVSSIWLTLNLNALVIPLVSCANVRGMQYMLDGMDDCSTVAFSTKGPMGDPVQMDIFKRCLRYTVDHMKKLRTIIVYTASPNRNKVLGIFRYALEHDIDVIIPDNTLRIRNRLLGGGT